MINKLIEEIGFTCSMMNMDIKEISLSPELHVQLVDELSKIHNRNLSGVEKFKGIKIVVDNELNWSFKVEIKR